MSQRKCEKCTNRYEIIYAALLDFAAIISWEHGRLGGTEKESGVIKLAREARNRIEQSMRDE